MKMMIRVTALAVAALSFLAWAGPAPAAAPAAPPAKGAVEYPLSCNAAAKPLYAKGWTAMYNAQAEVARASFKEALTADPKCLMAKLYLGLITPGAEGKAMADEAIAAATSATLSDLEKLDVQAAEARQKGDAAKVLELRTKARDLAPAVFSTSVNLADTAIGMEKWDVALAAAKRAAELDPKAGAAWNQVGYANLNLKKLDDAVAAFKKYVEVAPNEPNAHDSLADALLANNQLDEAAAEYQKAIDTSGGKFWMSWSGVATVKGLKGDFEGARAAIAKGVEAATQPNEKLNLGMWTSALWAAQGKLPDALKAIDSTQKSAEAGKLEGVAAWSLVGRGFLQLGAGKYADALKDFAKAEKAKLDAVNEGMKREITATRLQGVVQAQARLGKIADAEKALGQLSELYKDATSDPAAVNALGHARGEVALAKKDAKGAVEALKACTELGDWCRMTLAEAQEKAGDAAAAAETRAALVKVNHRDPMYLVVRAKVEAAAKTPGKKVAAEGAKK